MTHPTPAELRELAARADALAAAIDTARERLQVAEDEPTRRSTYRLPDAAGDVRGVGQALHETAEDLARIRGRSTCGAD